MNRQEDDWFPKVKQWTKFNIVSCFIRWLIIWTMIALGIICFFGDKL